MRPPSNAGKKPSWRWLCSTILFAALVVGGPAAQAAPQATLTTHVPAAVATGAAVRVGVPDPSMILHLSVVLPMRNQTGLDAVLRGLYDPASPSYRHYLSVPEFTDRFGPTAVDYAAAVSFLANAGLQVIATSANRYMVELQAPVADVERVFHVTMGLYRHPAEARNFLAPDREPTLDLAVPVLHINGLDDFTLPTPRLKRTTNGTGKLGTGSGPGGAFLGSDVRAAYYGGTALTGAGQSLGLMELAGYRMADIKRYFHIFGQKLSVPVNGISVDGTEVECPKCDDGEQVLDIDYAISMAPGMEQVQVYIARSPESVLNRMASDNISKQLSTSWGWGENFAVDDPLFKEMAAQGQTFLTASGDYSNLKDSGPWPEEDANLTAVGGTDLRTAGPAGPWKSETGWADSAGGPSRDKSIRIETYQYPFINAANNGSRTRRNVPDIAGDADFDNIICSNDKCQAGWGGTSFASPIWAGFIALVNEQAAQNGAPPVGFLNPTIYALAGSPEYTTSFHDEIYGRSGVYKAVKKYDLVTGLGSPDGQGLINALAGVP